MESLFEQFVLGYLTHTGDTFVCPQFPIKDENGKHWSSPDLVALRFSNGRKEVYIVEVSTAHDMTVLAERVNDRDNRWIRKLRAHLTRIGAVDELCSFKVKVFVRKERKDDLTKRIGGASVPDVQVQALDEVVFSWKWPWTSD